MSVPLDSLPAVLVFAGAYLAGGRLTSAEAMERLWSRHRTISAAAGISVAYVFVDVLPELELQRKAITGAVAGGEVMFAEQRLYLLALVTFVVVYGLEHMVLISRGRGSGSTAVFRLQLAGYALYSALIGYLVVDRAERGVLPLALYTFAMAVHFLIVDHSLAEEHAGAYAPSMRILLAASVLAGWLIAVVTPLSEALVARLFAVLAGGVILTSLRAELPDDREGRFWPFCLGAASYTAVLLFA